MEFSLNCRLTLSKDLKGIDIKPLIENSKEILKKGAPNGKGAEIEQWSVSGDRIDLRISSGRYVRPHDAIFRLKNLLSQDLGKEYHIGIREIFASKYVIKLELDNKPKAHIKIPFAKKVEFKGKECILELENLDEEFLQKNYVDRMINLINEKIDLQYYEGKAEHWELLWQSEEKKPFWNKDPTNEMVKRNWIKHRGRGQWIFGPVATKIIKTVEQIVVEELLNPLKFNEVIIPKAVTWDVWKKSGHAKNIYGEIYFICPPKSREHEFWEEVIDLYKITGEIPLDLVKENIKEPIGGVSYAQCPPLWPYFEGRILSNENLPIKFFDRSGPSMRYESGGIHGIERVDEFHRIELVWIGTQEQVKKLHEEIIEYFKKIFNKILDIEWRMARVTPWFMAQEGLMRMEEERKDIGTVDFEAYLPYKGSRKESQWLEFQNASNNGDKYPNGFNVKSQGNEKLWSGCAGVGLERWLAVFTAQKGLEPDKWPKEFRKRIKELPSEVKFM